MAPAGESSLTMFWGSDMNRWKAVEADPARYVEEKREVADTVVRIMEERFTGNRLGAMQAWKPASDMPPGAAPQQRPACPVISGGLPHGRSVAGALGRDHDGCHVRAEGRAGDRDRRLVTVTP
jgi:hypothetical protein